MSENQPSIIILIGRSGSGKGTQVKLLTEEFGFGSIASGDLLRERASQDDFSGRKLKEVMERGGRVPTPLMFQVWGKRIEEIKNKENFNGLVVDGSPRSLLEAKLMNSIFKWYNWIDFRVISLDISEQEAFDRLTKRRICQQCGRLIPWLEPFRGLKRCDQCGGELIERSDDTPEAIKERLAFYKKDVEPALDYYQKRGRLIRVNGEQSIEDVYREIKSKLNL